MNNQDYSEVRIGERLNVNWHAAVITYTAKVFLYGWIFGASVAMLSVLVAGLPKDSMGWLRAGLMTLTGGGIVGGFLGAVLVILKDFVFPYTQPYERTRTVPIMAAPESMKPKPMMRVDGSVYKYGKVKLEPFQMLALAQAVLASGETMISQRKLAEWGVVTTKESAEAKQLKIDLEHLGYGLPSGNDQLVVAPILREYLAQMFPALTPLPQTNMPVSNGVSDRHRHQTPPKTQE